EDDVGEQRAGLEDELAAPGLPHRDPEQVGRQHVGGELDPLEAGPDRPRERGGEGRLADAGDVLDQEVAAGEEPDDREPDGLRLADQRPADARLQAADEGDRRGHGIPILHAGRGPAAAMSARLRPAPEVRAGGQRGAAASRRAGSAARSAGSSATLPRTARGAWAASSARENLPLATATQTAPAARADRTSCGVSPTTTVSAGATSSRAHASSTGSGAGRCSATSSSQTTG